jgi:endonuclease/exonuclease/phosphatase (EEP) superfamily protein YafD
VTGRWTARGARGWIALGLVGALAFGMLVGVAGFFGRFEPWGEIASHFPLVDATSLAAVALALLVVRERRWALAGFVAALVCLGRAAPDAWAVLHAPTATPAELAGRTPFRLMSFNVYGRNDDHAAVRAEVARWHPDLLVIVELRQGLAAGFGPLRPLVEIVRTDDYGLGLYGTSEVEATSTATMRFDPEGSPSLVADVTIKGKPLALAALHTPPPGGARDTERRDATIAGAVAYLARRSAPRLLVGDLNLTPYSPVFGDTLATSGLVDTRRSLAMTWPSWSPVFPLLAITIDHALVSPPPAVLVTARTTGDAAGSDHRPIIVDLAL